MKSLLVTFLITMFMYSFSDAQLREDLNDSYEYTTSVTHTQEPSKTGPGNWMNMLNMTMSHSYSMTFSSIGGQAQNINAYTNSMYFDVSENVNAQVDVSFLHSPFGSSLMNNDQLGSKIIIEQARIDYKLSKNANLSIQFSQNPYYSGYGRSGFGRFHSPFNRHSRNRF